MSKIKYLHLNYIFEIKFNDGGLVKGRWFFIQFHYDFIYQHAMTIKRQIFFRTQDNGIILLLPLVSGIIFQIELFLLWLN